MKELICKIKSNYRVTLPKIFREKYNIQEGDFINMKAKDGKLIVSFKKELNNTKN